MSITRPTVMSTVALSFVAALLVGGPYAYLISKACEPASVSEFFADARAFHTREGC